MFHYFNQKVRPASTIHTTMTQHEQVSKSLAKTTLRSTCLQIPTINITNDLGHMESIEVRSLKCAVTGILIYAAVSQTNTLWSLSNHP